MNTSMAARTAALSVLIDHARRISLEREKEVLGWRNLVTSDIDGRTRTLPAYAPYIGASYFNANSKCPKILVLALSQNIRVSEPWVQAWLRDWLDGDGELALDRQNREFAQTGYIAIWPFDTGHLPIVAAMVRDLVSNHAAPEESIYECVTATNLSKWSFRSDDGARTQDSPEALEKCWEWLTLRELDVLAPEFIVCAGNQVFDIVSARLARLGADVPKPRALKVSFPSQQVINLNFRGEPSGGQASIDRLLSMIFPDDMSRSVQGAITLGERVRKDARYFAEMYDRLVSQLRA